jgi:hypothetical protein
MPLLHKKGRATKGASFIRKAYLYQDNLQKAATLIALLISKKILLVADYNSIFESEGENGLESVLKQYTDGRC